MGDERLEEHDDESSDGDGESPFIDDDEEEESSGRGTPKGGVDTRTSGEVGPEQMMLTTCGLYLWGEMFVHPEDVAAKLNSFGEF